jgi:hypothetical protein
LQTGLLGTGIQLLLNSFSSDFLSLANMRGRALVGNGISVVGNRIRTGKEQEEMFYKPRRIYFIGS